MRLLIALAGTAAGLAALLSYKTHAAGTTAAAPMSGTQGGGMSAQAGGAGTAASGSVAGSASPAPRDSTPPAAGSGARGSASPAAQGGTGGSAATRTLTGAVVNTQYGPMQVQVTLQGSKITGVKVLQETNAGSLSQQIDANAIPQLNRETLAAQSARIDAVSGASYTSQGYIQSLQSALDKATA
jgi:uncharacterized protein with FMN-binding domain